MKRLLCLLFCVSLYGCQQQEAPQTPDGLLSRDKMVQVLADIHLLESRVETSVPAPDTAVMVFNKYHRQIMQKYDITPEDFKRTYQYYGRNLEEMDKLYEIIIDTLTAREAKFEAQKTSKLKVIVADSTLRDSETIIEGEPALRKLRNKTPKDTPTQNSTSGTL